MLDSNVVVIPLQRYEELVQTETRVNTLVERISHNDFFSTEDVLWLLDTELSVELAQGMLEQRKKEQKVWSTKLLSKE